MRGGAAWPSTTVSDSCPTAGGTYETQPESGERSVCQTETVTLHTIYSMNTVTWLKTFWLVSEATPCHSLHIYELQEVQPKSDLPSQFKRSCV